MLRRNRGLSVIMALCLCLALLAPIFVAPPVAEAASTAKVSKYAQVGSATGQDLGVIKVTVEDFDNYIGDLPWMATVSFPTKLAEGVPPTVGDGKDIYLTYGSGDNAFTGSDVTLVGTATHPVTGDSLAGNGTFKIIVNHVSDPSEDGVFYIHFDNINTSNFSGDVLVNIMAGDGALDNMLGLKIATVNASGKTQAVAKSVRKITTSGGTLDNISISDLVPGTIEPGGTITLEMKSKGFEFDNANPGRLTGFWRFDGTSAAGTVTADGDKITFTVPSAANSQRSGMIGLSNIGILVDEKVARVGQDIEVKVSGAGITEQTLVVGQYVDYVINITLEQSTELIAGRSGYDDQYLGTFFIEEVAPGALVEERSILLELPTGLEWNEDETNFGDDNYEVVNNSSIELSLVDYIDQRTMKLEVSKSSANAQEGAKILFKNLAVDVSPSYRGDVTLKISGKAGAEGEVTVSKVLPMFTMEADTPNVVLGVKEQKVADVIITESKADAFIDSKGLTLYDDYAEDTALKFYLDDGFRFAKVPKVEVLEGDIVLELSDVKVTSPRGGQNLLIIPIRAGSYNTPAKIKISDIYITADRTAPTGPVTLYAADVASDWGNEFFFSNYASAFNNCIDNTPRFIYDIPGQVDVANNATVPPVENVGSGSATFVIGSQMYTVDGVAKVMDVAPYIKNSRTYVPYRYLAYALGVDESNVVWDEAAKTVTVTKGDITVVATIGSTTLTVNGQAQTMDVAPEIYNSRTMLPARFLAEALGAAVGWDPATQTVVIEY